MAHNGYVYGVKTLKFNNIVLGQISEDSIDWGGDEPTTIKIFSAQNRNTPVLELKDTPGTDELSFDLIELKPDNLIAIFGGSKATAGGYTLWSYHRDFVSLIGQVEFCCRGRAFVSGIASLGAMLRRCKGQWVLHCKLRFLTLHTS